MPCRHRFRPEIIQHAIWLYLRFTLSYRDVEELLVAAWPGWTLDAFDFTAFLLIIAPIAKEFDAPVPEVAAVSASAGSHAGKVRHFESELLAIAPFRSQVR